MILFRKEAGHMIEQLSLFPEATATDPRPPETVTWNLWCGCTKVSYGCQHCYMFRRSESVGRDPAIVRKTQNFSLPVRKLKAGSHKGFYKVPAGSHFFTCFTSDFFHKDADEWRPDAWNMIRERSDCTFFMITKRPERIKDHLPHDWNDGWNYVTIAVTCENQWAVDKRLPGYLELPLPHHSVMVEPMLSKVNLRPFLETGIIEAVSAGGESGPEARPCDYAWVLDLHMQCVENGVSFSYHQTGAKLIKGGKEYLIPREHQHEQARKAHLDFDGRTLLSYLDIPGE